MYWGGRAIAGNRYHFDLTTNLDRRIPFVPGFVYIYLICYLFWIVNYVLAAGNGKDYFYGYLSAVLKALMLRFLFFVFFPTTNTRPELVGTSLSVHLLGPLHVVLEDLGTEGSLSGEVVLTVSGLEIGEGVVEAHCEIDSY